jgi:hypothetical protein
MAGIEIKKNKKLKQKQKQKQTQNVKQSVVVRIENPKSKPRRRKAVSKPRARDSVVEPAVGVRYMQSANYYPNQLERPQPVVQPVAPKETIGGFYERGQNEEFMRRLLYESKERSERAFMGAPSPKGQMFGEGSEDQQQEDIDNQFGEPEPIVQGGAVEASPSRREYRPRNNPILTKAQKIKLLRQATGRTKADLEKLDHTEIVDLMDKYNISLLKEDHPDL